MALVKSLGVYSYYSDRVAVAKLMGEGVWKCAWLVDLAVVKAAFVTGRAAEQMYTL